MFQEQLTSLHAQFDDARRERAELERDKAQLAAENTKLTGRVERLEADLVFAREQETLARTRTADLQAQVAQLPVLAQAADAERTRARLLQEKLDVAKTRLAEAAEREKALAATVAERDREVDRLTVELEASRLIVEAVRRVEADVRVIAATVAKS